ncbi:MAG TPA: LLM class F420-dependent oxidoreductase [Acidimicrobiales bacterium]|nr:LLM class F420-dependent oxidoreductase [Acidimicrobiales bacterium]
MRFSVWPSSGQSWEDVLAIARHAEATGWDGVWIADHFMPNAEDVSGPMLECWATLAGLAASVPRVRLGALVSGNTYRHPAVLAKTATTIDHISGGRVVLGLGAGWQENEHRAYGLEFFDTRTRLRRLEEACEVVKRLTTEERVEFSGEHYSLVAAPLEPKPVQSPLPLLVGGGGEKVTMRIAARWADEWNVWGDPATLAQKGAVLDEHCERLGRDPAAIARSAQTLLFLSDDEEWLAKRREAMGGGGGRGAMIGRPSELVDTVGAYVDAGVDELIVPDFTLGSGARKLDTYDRFITEVAAAFRG